MVNTFSQIVQMVGVETGNVQTLNTGKDDDGTPLYYELQTQEIEFGNRAHLKSISDLVVVLNEFGIDSSMEAQQDDGDFKPIPMNLSNNVNIGKDINLDGNYFTFKWSGVAQETSPVFQGIGLEGVQDLGIIKN